MKQGKVSDMYGKEYLEWKETENTGKDYLKVLDWYIDNSCYWFTDKIYALGHNTGLKLARSLYENNLRAA